MSSIKKDFLYNVSYQILNLLVPLVTTPLLSRTIGAEGIGEYAYSYSIAYYFFLFTRLGTGEYGNRSIAAVRNNKEQRSKVFWSIYSIQFCAGILSITAYVTLIPHIGNVKIQALLLGYVLSSILDVNWFFFGMGKFKLTVIRNTVIKLATTVLIVLLVRTSEDVLIYTAIMSAGFFFSQAVLWPYLRKEVSFYLPKWSEILVHIKPCLFLFIPTVSISLYRMMDKIMLGSLADTVQVGFFENVEKIENVPVCIITALGTVMLPTVTNMLATGRKREVQGYLVNSFLFAAFLSSAMAFGLITVSKEFIPLFLGPGFEECINIMYILMPSCIFIAYANVLRTQYLVPNKRDSAFVASVVAGGVVNVIANLILIPKFQARGTAVATLLSEFMVAFVQTFCIRRELPIKKYIYNTVPFVVSGILMCLAVSGASIMGSPVITLFVKIMLGIAVYLATLMIQATVMNKLGFMTVSSVLKEILFQCKNRLVRR